jgi:Dyp-type peroxidase family
MSEISTRTLDPRKAADLQLLTTLQGNILKGHGRDFGCLIVVSILTDTGAGRLRSVLRDLPVTSAKSQWDEARAFRQRGVNGPTFVHVAVSARGWARLGLKKVPTDVAYRGGLARASRLGDPPKSEWESAYQSLDVVLLLADGDLASLTSFRNQLLARLQARSDLSLHIESAYVMRDSYGQPVEHFGFADGLSQPIFLTPDLERYRRSIGEQPARYDPTGDPFLLVLAEDTVTAGTYGSYLVFRKLEQDVARYRRLVLGLSRRGAVDAEFAAALTMGRFRDGTPLAERGHAAQHVHPEANNDFDYEADQSGVRCPLHAHVRKSNPRTGDAMVPFRRIARRGMAYGLPGGDGGRAGLFFLCYQQDISRQFEFIQSEWANRAYEGGRLVGTDPVSARASVAVVGQQWPKVWSQGPAFAFDFGGCVQMRGGEYLFAPSIPTIRSL